ncbi:SDR family NAD(P)-dependent oxidoreductase [Streptomyces sp. NPDC005480]|uniref:SDR family NAD(P)-dependent oxidoreductase n=1 Tax=Streptomyces sp. NPDC005480 TaxID=3154880 RepID=UPI0033AB3CF1
MKIPSATSDAHQGVGYAVLLCDQAGAPCRRGARPWRSSPWRPGALGVGETLREELLAAHPGITRSVRSLDVNDHQQAFNVFHALREDLGELDWVIVNAGLGKGQPIGTGRFDVNLRTAQASFTAALAQCEAAMEIFRAQSSGHLVVVRSPGFRSLWLAVNYLDHHRRSAIRRAG